MVSGHAMASNAPVRPAFGSVAKSKLIDQLVPPFEVLKTLPTAPASAAKHRLVLGQLIALRVVALPTTAGALQVVPSVVLVKVPPTLIAKHVEVAGTQLMPA